MPVRNRSIPAILTSAATVVVAVSGLGACASSTTPTATGTSGARGPAWCGTKPIVFGMQDGGGLNAWSKTSAAEVLKAVKECPNITKVLKVNAQFNLQTAISGLQGMVAQGANAIVIIPDAGGPGSELAGVRSVYQRGIPIVAYAANPGGEPERDYLAYVDLDHRQRGKIQAEWMAKQLPKGGNVALVGGPAGNAPSTSGLEGIVDGLRSRPDIKLVTGVSEWAVGNWDPAAAQQAMSGVLSQHPKIDGVFFDEGLSGTGIVRAMQAANRPLVPMAGLEANGLACLWKDLAPKNPGFTLATTTAFNVTGRISAQMVIAKAAGVTLNQTDAFSPTPLIPATLLENSLDPKAQPNCQPSRPPSALLSADVTDEELKVMTRATGS